MIRVMKQSDTPDHKFHKIIIIRNILAYHYIIKKFVIELEFDATNALNNRPTFICSQEQPSVIGQQQLIPGV